MKRNVQSPGPKEILYLLKIIQPAWLKAAAGTLLIILTTGFNVLLPLSSKALIDYIILKKGIDSVSAFLSSAGMSFLAPLVVSILGSLNFLVLTILVLGLFTALLGLVQQYLIIRFQQDAIFNLQSRLFEHLLKFPISFFKDTQVGYLISRTSDDVYIIQTLFSETIPHIVSKLLYLVFGLFVISMIDLKLTVIAISILPVFFLLNYFLAGRLRKISYRERETHAKTYSDIQEVISGVETVKSFTAEKREHQRIIESIGELINTRIKRIVLTLFSRYSVKMAQLFSTIVVMWFGVHEIWKNRISIGDYVAFSTYILFITNTVSEVSLFHLMIQPAMASLRRIREMFQIAPESDVSDALQPHTFRGELVFQNVSYCYEGHREVLREINLSIKPGETVAIIGPTGTGKTTLVNLVLKFYTPTSGKILLDGHDLRIINTRWLRAHAAVVSQDIFIFNDSVENNIRYGKPGATHEEVVDAARLAQIHKDILLLPEGYRTIIGERGARLSAGQRQRISIARAFLKNPSILILDEPTSALDMETESALKDSLRHLAENKTTLIITHRENLLEIADRVYLLENGRLIEKTST